MKARELSWMLELDVPFTSVITPAYEKAQHALDIKPVKDLGNPFTDNIFHDTQNGLIFLRPSTFTDGWRTNIMPIEEFVYTASYWQKIKRASKSVDVFFIARVTPTGNPRVGIGYPYSGVIPNRGDATHWVMRSNTILDADESFTFYIQSSDDEFDRQSDYFYVKFSRYGLKVDTHGNAEFYAYDQAGNPKLRKRWVYSRANPIKEAAAFTFIPAPPLGILIIYSILGTPTLIPGQSNTERAIQSSVFVDLGDLATPISDYEYSIAPAGELALAININFDPIIAFERVRYPSLGVLMDAPITLGLTTPTANVIPLVLYARQRAVIGGLRTEDDSANWNGEPTAFAKFTIATTDPKYTPFMWGYFIETGAQYATRNTQPVVVTPYRIEMRFNDRCRDEGLAEIIAEPHDTNYETVRLIVARGDTTYRLSYWDGNNWIPVSVGYASTESFQLDKRGGRRAAIRASLNLRGMWSRFTETFLHTESAYDGMLLNEAFNRVLRGAGFEPIRLEDFPAGLVGLRLPTAGEGGTSSGWRYAPRVGQTGLEILKSLLSVINTLTAEYRLRYDIQTNRFKLEQKVAPLEPVVFNSEERPNQIRYMDMSVEPRPPEANMIWVEGATRPDGSGERIVSVLVNGGSRTNPARLDYLGRLKTVRFTTDLLTTEQQVDKAADMLYRNIARHNTKATITIPFVVTELFSLPRIGHVYYTDELLLDGYIREVVLNLSKQTQEMRVIIDTEFFTDPRDL